MNIPAVKNKNALVSLVSGFGGGQIVVNIAQHAFGWSISTGWGLGIACGIAYVVLFFADKGIVGGLRRVLFGPAKR